MMNITLLLVLGFLGLEDALQTPAEKVALLIPGLASTDPGQLDGAVSALEALCFSAGRPGAESERKAVALAIAAKLSGDVPAPARLLLLRGLEATGKGEVVPALAKLIAPGNDASLREGARRALEANPHVNAKKELRAALRQADGHLRAGIVRSLGARRDFLATADLIEAAGEKDPEARFAALEALAEVGDISAVPVLEEALQNLKGLDLATAQRAYLRLADSLVRNGERGAARRVYDKAAGFSPAARCAALIGFARAGLQSEVNRIVESLGDEDHAVRGAAADAAASMPGDGMTKALLARLGDGTDPGLLAVLAKRGGSEPLRAVLRAAREGKDPAARAAAIRLLEDAAPGETSPGQVVDALLGALGSGGEPALAAEEMLSRLSGPAVTSAVASSLGDAQGEKREVFLRILGARRDPAALDAVKGMLRDPSAGVRAAALRTLGAIGDPSAATMLLGALREGSDAERGAAVRSLARLRGDEVGKAIARALESERGPARAALLRAAGARREAWSLSVLKAAAVDADPAVRLAAVEGLARAGDPSSLPILRDAALKGSPEVQRAAVRGCLHLADALAREKREDAVGIYRMALDLTKDEDDLRTALRGIAEIGGPELLEKILPYLERGPVQRDAGRAALRLAERLGEDRQAGARQIYEKILELDPDDATASQCVRRLRRLGVDVDFARKGGFVTRWWILAPLPNPGGSLWDRELAPERQVELGKGLELEGQTHAWKPYHTPNPRGLVVLEDAGYPQSNAGAYLYAEVTVDGARDAFFKLGSDDQIACWLNGVKVHANKVNRGLGVDQDTVAVKLAKGANRVLLKVLNDGGGWGACLRITGGDDKPLAFAQREP